MEKQNACCLVAPGNGHLKLLFILLLCPNIKWILFCFFHSFLIANAIFRRSALRNIQCSCGHRCLLLPIHRYWFGQEYLHCRLHHVHGASGSKVAVWSTWIPYHRYWLGVVGRGFLHAQSYKKYSKTNKKKAWFF